MANDLNWLKVPLHQRASPTGVASSEHTKVSTRDANERTVHLPLLGLRRA
jgi:hypothetical protein